MTPPPDPFDPDDPDLDPWADDPAAPREPGAAARGPAALLDPETRGEIEREILYQQTKAALAAAPPDVRPAHATDRIPLGFAGASLAVAFAAAGPRAAGAAALALAAHELGRVLGARVAGPLGAALLGPLPGLFAGFALLAAGRPAPGGWPAELGFVFAAVNAAQLIPVIPFAGGRLFDLLAPTRRPWPGTVGRLAVVAALAAACVLTDDWRVVVAAGLAAAVVLPSVPVWHRLARSRTALRKLIPGLPEAAAAMTDAQRRKVFEVALVLSRDLEPDRLAAIVRDLHGQAAARTVGPPASTAALAAYAAGVAAAVAVVGGVV